MEWVRNRDKMEEEECKKQKNPKTHDALILWFITVCFRAVTSPDSELQKDGEEEEEEEEDSLLCDQEEMDLLGEIFDTLSSRSSHERGLLYTTRSLDLFGSDSHDYIMKV